MISLGHMAVGKQGFTIFVCRLSTIKIITTRRRMNKLITYGRIHDR